MTLSLALLDTYPIDAAPLLVEVVRKRRDHTAIIRTVPEAEVAVVDDWRLVYEP